MNLKSVLLRCRHNRILQQTAVRAPGAWLVVGFRVERVAAKSGASPGAPKNGPATVLAKHRANLTPQIAVGPWSSCWYKAPFVLDPERWSSRRRLVIPPCVCRVPAIPVRNGNTAQGYFFFGLGSRFSAEF
jgi:hypothetical protein